MGDVVVGVTFEVRFIGLIRLQIYLVVLEDPQRLLQPAGDLFADYVQVIGGYVEFLQLFR